MEGVRSMVLGWYQAVGMFMTRSRRIHADRGAVATEYGLVLMLIALVIIIGVTAFGFAVADLFQTGADGF